MKSIIASVVTLLAVVFCAQASDPVGIYALINEAKVLPNEEKPRELILKGAFSMGIVAPHRHGYRHSNEPRKGYLYFQLPTRGKEHDISLIEWKDILKLVKKNGKACVGMSAADSEGSSLVATLRAADTKPKNPDTYRITSAGLYKFEPGSYRYKKLDKVLNPAAGK